jgi:hypothetical protein
MRCTFDYYYNNVPEKGKCRNNLIYTSLISSDKKVFCQWYCNDEIYHGGHNEVVNPLLMEEKWNREIKYLTLMQKNFPEHVPTILEIDEKNKKIYLEIENVDMWEQAGCQGTDYSFVLGNWQDQMIDILDAHKSLGLYKYSLHPSSYFIVKDKLKSINYFFTYTDSDEKISINDVLSHISKDRRKELFTAIENKGITIYDKLSFLEYQHLAFDSFSNNFSKETIDKAKNIYNV